MRRHVQRIASFILSGQGSQTACSLGCNTSKLCEISSWRHVANRANDKPSAGQPASGIPYLTADIFGRPTISRPALPRDDGADAENSVPAPGPTGGRRSRARIRASQSNQTDSASIYDQDAVRSSPRLDISPHAPSQLSDRKHISAAQTSSRPSNNYQSETSEWDVSSSFARRRASRLPPPDPSDAAGLARALTFRLLKTGSLAELDRLLAAHPHPLNAIHLAATARQAVLLGGLPRPAETRTLLDRILQRWARSLRAADSQSTHPRHQLTPQQHEPRGSVREKVGLDAAAAEAGDGVHTAGAGPSRALVRKSGAVTSYSSSARPSALLPLRELGDVLHAYGKLRAKPPSQVWDAVLRPPLLDPAALLQQLRTVAATEAAAGGRGGPLAQETETSHSTAAVAAAGQLSSASGPVRRGKRGAGAAAAPDAAGQVLTTLVVALARMRLDDADVWRSLARAAAVAAPELSPRALTSILWAFGAMRMTYGPLLAAAVRSIRLDLPQYNGQDLVCAMWALARLAPPPEPYTDGTQPLPSRAAAAAEAARVLLYGDLSDAVRRRMQLLGLKSAELTTLIGALDEMANHQLPNHHPYPSRNSLQVSPKLIRVVSQGLRKSMSELPVGALAEAAAAAAHLGVADSSLYRALGSGLLVRSRHLAPRQLVRAALALEAAGYTEGGFHSRLLDAARPHLASYRPHELLSLLELCGRLTTQHHHHQQQQQQQQPAETDISNINSSNSSVDDSNSGVDDSNSSSSSGDPNCMVPDLSTTPTPTGSPKALQSSGAIDPDTASAFLHASVLQAVTWSSSSSLSPSTRSNTQGGVGAPRQGGGGSGGSNSHVPKATAVGVGAGAGVKATSGDGDGDELSQLGSAESHDGSGDGSDGPQGSDRRLRLGQWHTVLRIAAAAGTWQDIPLADRAVDAVLREVRHLGPRWLTTVRQHAAERVRQRGRQERGPEEAVAPADGGGQMYDATAGDLAGVPYTVARLRQVHRLDVVGAAVELLLEGLRVAGVAEAQEERRAARRKATGGVTTTAAGANVSVGLVLSPAAAAELSEGLVAFGSQLEAAEHRRLRMSVQLLQQRLLAGG